MKSLTALLCFALLLQSDAMANRHKSKQACAEVKQQIRRIESKMRSGYTHAQGERYKERLRELKARRYKLCR